MSVLKNPLRWIVAIIVIVGFIIVSEAMGYSPGVVSIVIVTAVVGWVVFFGVKGGSSDSDES